ncbi:hypothetical protein MMC12_005511 [Toensbergia leucococca]|nr:hypothetical protein [Toensbergia leucococca]
MASTLPSSPSRKRKREVKSIDEIEVDIDAPEPPSKKALRKAKKVKKSSSTPVPTIAPARNITVESSEEDTSKQPASTLRSEYGVWIGNLPWSATKADLNRFLTANGVINEDMITRIHMPVPTESKTAPHQKLKPQNKGFAYVDFSTKPAMVEAIALSEALFVGRRVLIKDSKSFEGRPEKLEHDADPSIKSGKPTSKRIFVGNLAFDTTEEELQEHFERCGEVANIFIATFEDSGKCKGYAWVEFQELDAGKNAIRGWVDYEQKHHKEDEQEEEGNGSSEDEEIRAKPREKSKPRKWWVNRLKGRPLRMEFAEDKAIRYKKRFGKDGTARGADNGIADVVAPDAKTLGLDEDSTAVIDTTNSKGSSGSKRSTKPPVLAQHGFRIYKSKAPLTEVSRLTGSIVESKGKRTTFD